MAAFLLVAALYATSIAVIIELREYLALTSVAGLAAVLPATKSTKLAAFWGLLATVAVLANLQLPNVSWTLWLAAVLIVVSVAPRYFDLRDRWL